MIGSATLTLAGAAALGVTAASPGGEEGEIKTTDWYLLGTAELGAFETYSMIDSTEHKFSVIKGDRGFVKITGDRCRYP